ncbi:MAG: hypothetical protein HY535_01385, partial [Chloroflexi bacterium]|nr:hypothetical protein [Chloroflexota bacterium]
MLSGLADIFADHAPFQGLAQALQAGGQRRASILQAAKPLFIGALWRALNVPVLVVCPKPEDARRLYDRVLAYWGEDAPIHHFVELEALPFERLAQDLASVHQRLKALAALAADAGHGPPPLVVTSALGVAVKTLPPAKFLPDASPYSMVRRGDRISLEGLLAHWASLGYRMEPHTEMPGTMSRRGGIVDVFPPTAALPIRLELWGDVVEGLRAFDPGTQRSLGPVELVSLVPAQEVLPAVADRRSVEDVIRSLDYSRCRATVRQGMEEELSLLLSGQAVEETTFYTGLFNGSSLLDFLPSQGLLVLDEPAEVEEASRDLDRRSWELRTLKVERGEVPGGFPSPYWGWDDVAGRLARAQKRLHLSRWAEDGSSDLVFVQAPSFWGRLDAFLQEALGRMQRGERVLAVTNHAQRLQEVMAERDLASLVVERLEALPPPGSVTLVRGSLGEGWVSSSATGAVALFTDGELFGTVKVSRPRRTRGAAREVALEELVTGSYVVHIDHGVARFAGTTTLEHDEEAREYLVLEYAEDDKLYVPTDHLDRVARYVASGDEPPSLTRLGTQEWLRIKERVRRSTQEMAQELLALYAAREVAQGIPLAADSPWQRELEDSFPYVETPDQVKAIGEVKREMELPRPMDRLVCGDVGYGKT